MKSSLCILFAAIFATQAQDDAATKDLKAIQGKWTMVGLEANGRDAPADKLNADLVIKDSEYIVMNNLKTTVVLKLDPTKNPKEMDMIFKEGVNKEKVHKAIYKLEKDLLIIARGLTPEQDRPREFATWPDTDYFVVKWKKVP